MIDRDGPPPAPVLSVVVAATDSPVAVARTLASLAVRGGDGGRVEVIVAAAWASEVGPGPGEAPDPVRRISGPPGAGVPRLRRLGLEAATGRVVAFTEDSCVAAPGWSAAWSTAFADPALVAASGVVEHDEAAPTLDWAVFACEYAPFLAPAMPGPPPRLAGNNFAATREAALRESPGEVHETALLAAIRRRGGATRTVDRAVVRHVRRYDLGEAIGDRLRSGLEFGSLRPGRGPGSWPWRLAGLLAGPAIFAAQASRLAATILRRRRHAGRFAEALPLTLALLAAWSVGESIGRGLRRRPAPARPAGCRRHGTAGRPPAPPTGRSGSPPAGCTAGPPAA